MDDLMTYDQAYAAFDQHCADVHGSVAQRSGTEAHAHEYPVVWLWCGACTWEVKFDSRTREQE